MSPNVDLPVIDISRPSQEVGDALVDAAARYGFVFVKGSNISPQQADRTFQLVSHPLLLHGFAVSDGFKHSLMSSLLRKDQKKKNMPSVPMYVCRPAGLLFRH